MDELPATVVTGAATGMGRALCERLAARGAPVVAVDLNDEVLAWPKSHDTVVPLVADIATEAGNQAMVDLAIEHFGTVGGAALNAGVCIAGGIDTMPLEQFDLMWAVNLRGLVLGIRAVLPALRAGGGGAIVATASIGGLVGDPSMWAYNATKAAIVSVDQVGRPRDRPRGDPRQRGVPGADPRHRNERRPRRGRAPAVCHLGPRDGAQALGNRSGDGRGDGLPSVARRVLHHRYHHRGRRRNHRRKGSEESSLRGRPRRERARSMCPTSGWSRAPSASPTSTPSPARPPPPRRG